MHRKTKKLFAVIIIIILFAVIALPSQYKRIMGLFYPIKYTDLVMTYSRMYNLDPYLVFALINVESHYRADAESQRDAIGLMQVTPATGKWAAEKIGIKNFSKDMLFEPRTNIRIGCWYLNSLRQEFELGEKESDITLMLAAYNGGSGNVRNWLTNKDYSQTGTTLDQIPFMETQQYVEKVLRDYGVYKWLYPDIT